MASGDGSRANWKDPELYKFFIDACLVEVAEGGKSGGSLKKASWDTLIKKMKEKKCFVLNQKQLKNQWNYLKQKYGVWSKLIEKTGNGYDPMTNTVNWSSDEWDDYIKANPDAKQFRYAGLQYANEMKALFDGIGATGKEAWGPSKDGLPIDGGSSSQILVDDDSDVPPTLDLEMDVPKSKVKRHKKDKSDKLDDQLVAVLKTLEKSEGPGMEECNCILNEMQTLQMTDHLYIVACSIFCEIKAYREQWMMLSQTPEEVRKSWIQMNGKKLGLL